MMRRSKRDQRLGSHTERLNEAASRSLSNWMPPLLENAPRFTARGQGAYFEDVDGGRFLDYYNAAGAVLLGHSDPAIREAVISQLDLIPTSSIDSPLRVELARQVLSFFPHAQRAAFFKTGSEANLSAIRIARRFTKRSVILRCGFHGWYDWCSGNSSVPAEVRALTVAVPYNDLDALEQTLAQHQDRVAAFILQPGGDYKIPHPGYLEGVIERCHAHRVIVIFDEIRTGLRFHGGAQGYFGVQPDLTTISKGFGNGFPISALLGSRELLSLIKRCQLGGTYQRDMLSFAAALACLDALRSRGTIDHIHRLGARLMKGIEEVNARFPQLGGSVKGLPPLPRVLFETQSGERAHRVRDAVHQALCRRGVLFPAHYHLCPSGALSEADVDHTIQAFAESVEEVSELPL